MATARVLVVDDDPQIARALRAGLKARGYAVLTVASGEAALDALAEGNLDLALLDLGLPGMDGLEVLKKAREWTEIPIIVVTVREDQREKIAALDVGADDYVTKPFDIAELLARMRAVLRRASDVAPPPVVRCGPLEVDLARELVHMDGERVRLTPTEYRLLERMVTNPGKLLTHQWLLQQVWGAGYASESHYLRVFVRGLRKKLGDDPAKPRFITTEPGLGYRWVAEPAD